MLEVMNVFILVSFASFFGSINGLGVTFLISLFLLFIDKSNHQNYIWIPYLSTFVISLIFISTRLRIIIKYLGPIFYLCFFSAAGLLLGKIFKDTANLLWAKMFFGATIIFVTFYLNRDNFFSRLNVTLINNEAWRISGTDNFIIFVLGFAGGILDFSLAVLIYSYLILRKEEYSVEHLDVCVYSTLALTSFINFLFVAFTTDISIPGYFNLSYGLGLFFGAILARPIYRLITLEYKRKILIYALYSLGLKLLVINFLMEIIV